MRMSFSPVSVTIINLNLLCNSILNLNRSGLLALLINVIATKTQGNKSVGGTVKQRVVNNAPKKTESDTVTTEFKNRGLRPFFRFWEDDLWIVHQLHSQIVLSCLRLVSKF